MSAIKRAEKIAQLQAQIEAARAEIKQLQADDQREKAENASNDAAIQRDLTGNRDADGNLITEKRGDIAGSSADLSSGVAKEHGSGMDLTGQNEGGKTNSLGLPMTREMTADEKKLFDALVAGTPMTEELQLIANNMSEQDYEDTGMPIVDKTPLGYWDYTNDPNGEWVSYFPQDEKRGDIAGSATHLTGETGEHGSGMDLTGQNKEDEVEVEEDVETTKTQPLDIDDIEGDARTDAESGKMRHGGIDPEEGRTHPVESDVRNEKPGWEVAEGGNTWSINEKDDYWKTQEGFDEAMDLYGQKPSWLKEPTLVYNPETDEYEKIEEEEFEDLSRPTVSADIKKLFG